MNRRMSFALLAGLIALLASASPALAGGWAVITLDSLPTEVRAGQTQTIGFVVRQHGITPTNMGLDDKPLAPVVTIAPMGEGAGQPLQFIARQQGNVGHFVADVTFPVAGRWAWSISAPTFLLQIGEKNTGEPVFEPLTVLPAQAASATANTPTGMNGMLRWGGVALLVAALVALLLSHRARTAGRVTAKAS